MSPTDCLLDSGANCSIIKSRALLTNIRSCTPANFDGIGGALTIAEKEKLGPLCNAYFHLDLDYDQALLAFCNLRQRNNEHLLEYLQRFKGTLEFLNLIDAALIPTERAQATRFFCGLDQTMYGSLSSYMHNELNHGRNLYPSDLTSAVATATTWTVPTTRGAQEVAQHAAFGVIPRGKPKQKKPSDKKPADSKGKEEKPAFPLVHTVERRTTR